MLGTVLLCATACGESGDPDIDPIPDDRGFTRIASEDPMFDERLDALGILCQSQLSLSGTFTYAEGEAENIPCPKGTWDFEVTIDKHGCDPQPVLEDSYVYQATTDEFGATVMIYVPEPDNEDIIIATANNDGEDLCHGSFRHHLPDSINLQFRPNVYEDGTIDGDGTYTVLVLQ